MLEILKKYIGIKRQLGVKIFRLFFQNLWFPILVFASIFLLGFYSIKINHGAISTAMISVMSIVSSFLILSLTIVLTKENEMRVRNQNIRYKDVILSNILFSIFLSILSIGSIFFYILVLDSGNKTLLSSLCAFNFSLICFVFNTLINDLKFLITIYGVEEKNKINLTKNNSYT